MSALRSPSHSPVPIRGRKRYSGHRAPSPASSASLRCETHTVRAPGPSGRSAPTTSVSRREASEVCEPWASGKCIATPSSRAPGWARSTSATDHRPRALNPWRCMEVIRSSTNRARGRRSSSSRRSSRRPTVCTSRSASASSAVASSAVPKGRHGVSTTMLPPKRCATSPISSYMPTARVSQVPAAASWPRSCSASHCVRRASRPQPEPVAVALDDGHQPGVGRGGAAQVLAPARAVDGQDQAHRTLISAPCRG